MENGYSLTIIAGVMVGIGILLQKKMVGKIHFFDYIILKNITLAIFGLFILFYFTRQKTIVKMKKEHFIITIISAIFFFSGLLLLTSILDYYPVFKSTSIFNSTIIIFTTIIAILVYDEKVTIKNLFGIGLITTGIFFIQ